MAKLNAKKTLAAVTLAAVTLTSPAIAHANNSSISNYTYEDCKRADGENQLVGGLIGAVTGGVLGSQLAGNGARTEGSAIGALLGAGLGVAIGDDKRKCGTPNRRTAVNTAQTYNSGNTGYATSNRGNSSRTVYTSPQVLTVSNRSNFGNRGFSNQGFSNQGYQTSRGSGYNDLRQELRKIETRIDRLTYEGADLKKRLKYSYDPYAKQRLDEICYKLIKLEKQKKRIKREARRSVRNYHG